MFSLSVYPLYLTGVVPKELANLRSMTILDVGGNSLEGEGRVFGCYVSRWRTTSSRKTQNVFDVPTKSSQHVPAGLWLVKFLVVGRVVALQSVVLAVLLRQSQFSAGYLSSNRLGRSNSFGTAVATFAAQLVRQNRLHCNGPCLRVHVGEYYRYEFKNTEVAVEYT